MLEGLRAAAAGMVAQQQRMDALAEDVANVDTDGYKKQRISFRELMYTASGPCAASTLATGAGAAMSLVGRGFTQGALVQSDNPLDVALQGPGFLRVKLADGSVAYSRGGQLQLDARGRLVTDQGNLLDPNITLPAGTNPKDVSIGANGAISIKGKHYGKLTIENVGSPDAMRSVGDGLFATTAASGPATAVTGTTVQQGEIEGSNVDMADAMVDMMDAQRNYTLASRAVQMQDQMLEVANGIKK